MLVLSRKIGEEIVIGDNIVITVLGLQEGKVRFGVQAPREVSVHRREVHQRIVETNAIADALRIGAGL